LLDRIIDIDVNEEVEMLLQTRRNPETAMCLIKRALKRPGSLSQLKNATYL
jgi:transposase-like protein